jgi:hypothetical protein
VTRAPQVTYLMLNNRNGFVKIGVSLNPAFRERTLQSEEPEVLLIAVLESGPPGMERTLHREYADLRLRGEWFALQPEDVQSILRRGFEPIPGREDFYWAYSDAMTYDAWMKAKLINEYRRRVSDRDDGWLMGDADDEDVLRISDSLENFEWQ